MDEVQNDLDLNDFLSETTKLYYNGNIQQALLQFEEMERNFTKNSNDPIEIIEFLREYGRLLVINIRNYQPADLAIVKLKDALEIVKSLEDENQILKAELPKFLNLKAGLLDSLGFAHYFQAFKNNSRDFSEAAKYLDQSLKIQDHKFDPVLRSEILFHKGLIAEFSDELGIADNFYKLSFELGSTLIKSYAIRHQSNIARKLDNYPKAIEFMQRALKLREEIQFIFGIPYIYWGLGNLHADINETTLAKINYNKAQDIAKNIQDNRCLMFIYDSLGQLEENENQKQKAKEIYYKGLKIAKKISNKTNIDYFSKKINNLR